MDPQTKIRPHILVADDSPEDRFLLGRAFARSGFGDVVSMVENGEAAIDYLSQKPCPDLLLLDLKMPKVDGFDVLAWLQATPRLRELPVVVLSSSILPEDEAQAKALGAKDYLVKGHDFAKTVLALHSHVLSSAGKDL